MEDNISEMLQNLIHHYQNKKGLASSHLNSCSKYHHQPSSTSIKTPNFESSSLVISLRHTFYAFEVPLKETNKLMQCQKEKKKLHVSTASTLTLHGMEVYLLNT